MADQLRGDALFSYAVEHYLDTVYRAAFHAAPSPRTPRSACASSPSPLREASRTSASP